VVPAYNEEQSISAILMQLVDLDFMKEIIIVDNGSHDEETSFSEDSANMICRHAILGPLITDSAV